MDTEVLGKIVLDTLPHLSNDEATDIAQFLVLKGVKKERDLRHMTVAMLKEKLDDVDSSDLYEAWQNKHAGGMPQGQSSSTSTRIALSTIQPNSQNLQSNARRVNSCLPTFGADSPYFPSGVKTAIQSKKRPSASDRDSMVERVVDRCREIVPNFQRCQLDEVARAIVQDFPNSFKDTCPISDHGSDSLARQMKVKYDNDKRPKDSRTAKEKAAPATSQALGCLNWNPECPSDQPVALQEETKLDLQRTFSLSKRDWDWKTIKANLEGTFYLQRNEINGSLADMQKKKRRLDEQGTSQSTSAPTIADHKSNWPFLFTSKGLNVHYKILCGIDFKEKLHKFVTEQGRLIIDFLSCKNDVTKKVFRKMQRAEKQGHRSTTFPTLLKLLLLNFGEEPKNLYTLVERTTSTLTEVQGCVADFPEDRTPYLAIAGSSIYDYEKVFVSIDNTFVCKTESIQEGFAFIFCSYFVFNITYSTNLATVLNFAQRVVAEIPPSRGTKCASAVINRRVNDRIVKFSNKYELFRQKLDEEENEEEV